MRIMYWLKEKSVSRKARVSCEANRIGATGVGLLLLTRTHICLGARTAQGASVSITNGSDSCWFTEELTLALPDTHHGKRHIQEE